MRSTRFLFSGVLVGLCICLFAVSFSHASIAHEESKSDEAVGANEEKHLKGFLPHLPTFKKPLHHSDDFPKKPSFKKPIILPKPTSSSLFKKLFHPIYKKPLPHPIPVYNKPFPHHPIPTFKKPFFIKPIPHHDHPIFKKPLFKKPIPHYDHPIFKKPFFKKPISHDHPIFKKPLNYPKKPFVPIVP